MVEIFLYGLLMVEIFADFYFNGLKKYFYFFIRFGKKYFPVLELLEKNFWVL